MECHRGRPQPHHEQEPSPREAPGSRAGRAGSSGEPTPLAESDAGGSGAELRVDAEVGRCLGYSRHIFVLEEPRRVGDGRGLVRTEASTTWTDWIHLERLVQPIQERIDRKANDAQLDHAPDLKWLAVMPEYEPAWLLDDFFGPHSPSPHPRLDAITIDHFDEVLGGYRTPLRMIRGSVAHEVAGSQAGMCQPGANTSPLGARSATWFSVRRRVLTCKQRALEAVPGSRRMSPVSDIRATRFGPLAGLVPEASILPRMVMSPLLRRR